MLEFSSLIISLVSKIRNFSLHSRTKISILFCISSTKISILFCITIPFMLLRCFSLHCWIHLIHVIKDSVVNQWSLEHLSQIPFLPQCLWCHLLQTLVIFFRFFFFLTCWLGKNIALWLVREMSNLGWFEILVHFVGASLCFFQMLPHMLPSARSQAPSPSEHPAETCPPGHWLCGLSLDS